MRILVDCWPRECYNSSLSWTTLPTWSKWANLQNPICGSQYWRTTVPTINCKYSIVCGGLVTVPICLLLRSTLSQGRAPRRTAADHEQEQHIPAQYLLYRSVGCLTVISVLLLQSVASVMCSAPNCNEKHPLALHGKQKEAKNLPGQD